MKALFRIMALGGMVMLLAGCWGSGPETSPVTPIRFGILNSFPDHPLYLKKKTLVAMHKSETITALSPKSQFSESVKAFLEEKGYAAETVADKSALKDGRVDMLIEIVPRQVHKIEGMVAYGFSDRKFLLGIVNQPPRSYVSVELELSRKNSVRVVKTGREDRFSGLDIETMPGTWEELSGEDKEMFEANLRDNMAKAVYILLNKLKI